MQPIHRRNFLQWIGASLAAFGAKGVSAAVSTSAVIGRTKTPALRTEHFESGELSLDTAPSDALANMLSDLHARRNHDSACHPGETPPHFDYLTGWINAVTRELSARGYALEA